MHFTPDNPLPLPISWDECRQRGWTTLDILLVTGDGYVDHPSYGVALIGRLLLDNGFRVAILSQPRFNTNEDFCKFPAPKLFCGITAGNLDSIVANYSGNGKVRDVDAYSPDGNPWRGDLQLRTERRRPDRAILIYSSLAKSAFPNTPVVLGGIEASLRRFVHYDYKQMQLRASFLTDAKADILVYGMGEKAVLEIASRCDQKLPLHGIAGTCQRMTDNELTHFLPDSPTKNSQHLLVLPSWKEICEKQRLFLEAEIAIDHHARAYSSRTIVQRQQTHWVVQNPAQLPLTSQELDAIYNLPFTKRPHPTFGNIPAYRMIRDSITIVRGCNGNCSFCSITRHQGPAVVSRSIASILKECERLTQLADFSGTISDLGGPTANLYGTTCAIGTCKKHDCLFPKLCPNLRIDEDVFVRLLDSVANIKGVKKVFISSGLRMEILLQTPLLLLKILQLHTPGTLKIAPEHTDDDLLQLMHKEPHALLKKFVKTCREISAKIGKKTELTPYVIISHPGSTPEHAKKLADDFGKLDLHARKFQDFTPSPGTISTAMYVTGLRADTQKPLNVPRKQSERSSERQILEKTFHRYEANNKPHKQRKKR